MNPDAIGSALTPALGKPVRVHEIVPVGGGCISEAVRVQASDGWYFLKYSRKDKFPGMMEAEAAGLRLLDSAGALRIPGILAVGSVDDAQYLILEWLEPAGRGAGFWESFGKGLAALHRNTQGQFGWECDNYIGSLKQSNRMHDEWTDFFIRERLEPMVKLAHDSGKMDRTVVRKFDRFYSKLPRIFPQEPPALLHGDLWSGNYLESGGVACLFDPSVYYGHREMDIGMTRLFGGFKPVFYESYNKEYPLESGWEERSDFANLYPLLVHINLFGGGYLRQAEAILNQF